MADILFISGKKNFTVNTLLKMFDEQGNDVVHISYDSENRNDIEEKYNIMVIYSEEYSVDGLKFIKDRIAKDGKQVIFIGDSNQLKEVEKVIPDSSFKKKFVRPFHVKEVVEDITQYLKYGTSDIKKKILVVDDSGAMLRSVKAWLEDKYQVILANSGAMAIKYLATNCPDLILLDYEMPICDGKQVLEMIRAEVEFAKIPVIFLTNKNDKESVLSVSTLKPSGYLLKTTEPNQVVKIIDDFFEKRKWNG